MNEPEDRRFREDVPRLFDEQEQTWLAIDRLPFVIGRGAGSRLRIDHPSVSAAHAEIRVCESGYEICDRSMNGTRVEATRPGGTAKRVDLHKGDCLPLANGARMTFAASIRSFRFSTGTQRIESWVHFDRESRSCIAQGRDVTGQLTRDEAALMELFAERAHQVVPYEDLLSALGYRSTDADRKERDLVAYHIRMLRRKLELDSINPRHLLRVGALGYRFEPES